MAVLYLTMTDRQSSGGAIFWIRSIADWNNNKLAVPPPPQGCPTVTHGPRSRAGHLVTRAMLAKLVPRKLFSPTILGRYYDENRRGMGVEPQLTAELGP
jgi:hypothetical protein